MKDGSTPRDHLESVERQTGQRLAELDGPDLPATAAHIWRWFIELSAARGSNGWSVNPISWSDMAAWCALTATIIRPNEARVILRLDQVFRAVTSAPVTSPGGKGKKVGKRGD